jgi:hypothetical protein
MQPVVRAATVAHVTLEIFKHNPIEENEKAS